MHPRPNDKAEIEAMVYIYNCWQAFFLDKLCNSEIKDDEIFFDYWGDFVDDLL